MHFNIEFLSTSVEAKGIVILIKERLIALLYNIENIRPA